MAAVRSNASVLKIDTKFDYVGVKMQYTRQIEQYFAKAKLDTESPWTRKVIDEINSIIEKGDRMVENGHLSKVTLYKVQNKYEMYNKYGKQKLILKRKTPKDPIILVEGAEDCFDIIVDAHIRTSHGGYEKVVKTLEPSYSVPKMCIGFIIASCNVCMLNCSNKPRKRIRANSKLPQDFHGRGQVSLINMCLEPDHDFKYILFYLDRFTKYMLLRPLMTNSYIEGAMELMKIFFDIGPPQKLESYDRVYFGRVLSLVRAAHTRFSNISLIQPVKLPDISASNVKEMLDKWRHKSGSRNWAMGCYIVQWENNCSNKCDDKSPYETVFNMKPWHYSQSNSKSLQNPIEASNNNESSQGNDPGILVTSDNSEDGGVSNLSEIAEITEENGEMITVIPLNAAEICTLRTENFTTPVDVNQFPTKDVIIEQPLQIMGNLTAGSLVSDITQDLDDIPASMIVKGPEPLENLKCHVCKTLITKPYTCIKCNRFVHVFCSDRLMRQDIPLDVGNVICTACTILAKQNEPKSNEINNDVSAIVLDDTETASKKMKM